jgi:capsular polysaccharide biosynthesis protein
MCQTDAGDRHFRAAGLTQGKVQHLVAGRGLAADRLFLSRSDAAHRFLVNEEELFSALSVHGFRRIVPGRMTVREQIEAFSRARMIVAPHGAALTNIIFCPPGLQLIEISSSNILHMADFRWIAQVMTHRTTTIVSDEYVIDPQRRIDLPKVNWDYRVSVPEVLRAVRSQL